MGHKASFAGILALLSVIALGWQMTLSLIKPRTFDESTRLKELTELDPAVGADLNLQGVPKAGRIALVWVGDCTACSIRSLSERQIRNACPIGTKVILMVPRGDLGGSYPSLPKLVLTKEQRVKLNACFAPRVYVIQDDKLMHAQLRTRSPLEAIRGRS